MGLLERFGRRPMWMMGLWAMLAPVGTLGILSVLPTQTSGVIWAQGVLVLVRFFAYGISCGPIPFVYCECEGASLGAKELKGAEIGSVKLRSKTLGLSRTSFYAASVLSSAVGPYLLNPTAANLKGKSALISVGFLILIIIWSYYRFPETKGRTFDELDILFG